jgi:hypothetical protein
MFGTPGVDPMIGILNFIVFAALVLVGLVILRIILNGIETFFRNHKRAQNALDDTIVWLHRMPKWIKQPIKWIGVVIYLALCVLVIIYSGS